MIINLLNDKVTYKVLLLISYAPGRGYKYSEIKSALNMNNSSLYKIIHKLSFYDVIKKENNFLKFNFNNPLSEQILNVIEIDKKRWNNLGFKPTLILLDFLSQIDKREEIENVILFGSYAKKTNTQKSDIDIAIISKDKIDLFEIAYNLEETYSVKIEIHNFATKDFKEKSNKLIREIVRDGIYLK